MDGEAAGQSLATEHGGVFATLGAKEEAGEKNAVRKLVRRQIQFKKFKKKTQSLIAVGQDLRFQLKLNFSNLFKRKKQQQDRNISKTAK